MRQEQVSTPGCQDSPGRNDLPRHQHREGSFVGCATGCISRFVLGMDLSDMAPGTTLNFGEPFPRESCSLQLEERNKEPQTINTNSTRIDLIESLIAI